MAKLLRDMYWRCSRCGHVNRIQTVVATYEPTTYTCDHCGEDSLVEAHDLAEAQGKFRVPKRRPAEEEDAEDRT